MRCDPFSITALDSTDVDMGFCMATTGMTQGAQPDMPVEEDVDCLEDGKAESMEDDQDPEVLLLVWFIVYY